MLGQAIGMNKNLSALTSVLRSLFPLSAFKGTFTMAAAATKTVTDANCKASSVVILQAANAAAGTLEGSSAHLYPAASNGSFLVSTSSGGNATGTEVFNYLLINVG